MTVWLFLVECATFVLSLCVVKVGRLGVFSVIRRARRFGASWILEGCF
jgi:hypothetical protein